MNIVRPNAEHQAAIRKVPAGKINQPAVPETAALPQPKPKIKALDMYRALAILAVVIIHVTSNPVVRLRQRPDSGLAIFYELWNKFSQFAVPAFVFLSGLVLFYNYWDPERPRRGWAASFYKKRLLYIFVPYAVWSLLYFLMQEGEREASPFLHLGVYARGLLTGGNYEHLYYFVMLIQFYLLFPLLLKVLRLQTALKWLIPFAIVFQAAFYFLNIKVLHWPSGDVFATYFLLFSLGACFGMNFERSMARLRKWAPLILSVFAFIGLCFVFAGRLYYDWVPALLPYKMYINFTIYYLFMVSASFSLLLIAGGLFRLLGNSRLGRMVTSFGAASFAIFLVHPLLLHYWRLAVVDRYGAYYHYLTWLGGGIVFLASWVFYLLLRRWKWSQYFIGR